MSGPEAFKVSPFHGVGGTKFTWGIKMGPELLMTVKLKQGWK
jgi:hypothetical protein